MTRTRLAPKHRKQLILLEALHLAGFRGYQHITREEVAGRVGTVPGLINVYFPTIGDLRAAVLTEAIRLCVIPVVAQGLVMQDPVALDAPQDLKDAAASWVAGGTVG